MKTLSLTLALTIGFFGALKAQAQEPSFSELPTFECSRIDGKGPYVEIRPGTVNASGTISHLKVSLSYANDPSEAYVISGSKSLLISMGKGDSKHLILEKSSKFVNQVSLIVNIKQSGEDLKEADSALVEFGRVIPLSCTAFEN
jgi:hypothetical protein